LTDNTARLTSAMSDLPMLLEKKRLMDMHTSLATAVLDSKLQGVPRNMTLAGRIESRLLTFKLLVTFSLQPSFTCMIPETIITKFA